MEIIEGFNKAIFSKTLQKPGLIFAKNLIAIISPSRLALSDVACRFIGLFLWPDKLDAYSNQSVYYG
jgi:hypothetical protein